MKRDMKNRYKCTVHTAYMYEVSFGVEIPIFGMDSYEVRRA
jgi:hypothetical protein